MELTNKQQLGLQVAVQRFKNKEKYTCISVYASSDKNFWSNSTKIILYYFHIIMKENKRRFIIW